MSGDVLGHRVVEVREGVEAVIVRYARRWHPWGVILSIDTRANDVDTTFEDNEDLRALFYGHPRFEVRRGLRRYYNELITSVRAHYGNRRTEAAAEKHARKQLDKFIKWRAEQRRIKESLDAD